MMKLKNINDIKKTVGKKSTDLFCKKITFKGKQDQYKEWVIEVDNYPSRLAHFTNLKWPLQRNRFGNVEDFVLERLIKSRTITKKHSCVADALSWKAFASNAHSFRSSKVQEIFRQWLLTRPKKSRKRDINKFTEIIEGTRGNAFPDIVSFSSKDKTVSVWEVKAPKDSLSKTQKEILKSLNDSFNWDSNVVNVIIHTSEEKLSIEKFRQNFKGKKILIMNTFLATKTGVKINYLLKTECLQEVRNTFMRVSYLNPLEDRSSLFDYSPSEEDMVKLYRTQYELSSIFTRYFFSKRDLSFSVVQQEFSVTFKDIQIVSRWAFSMGYYRWWIFQVILMPSFISTKKNREFLEMLILGLEFSRKFQTWDEYKPIERIIKHYKNWDLKLLKKAYNDFICIHYGKLRNY